MIISFYSYKGGVGRSQLCANVASYLCHHADKKILLWDWDFEAPGLHYFFNFSTVDISSKGTIELLNKYSNLMRKNNDVAETDFPIITNEYITSIIKGKKGKIDLIPAGKYTDDYNIKVNDFDWYEFYYSLDGQAYIEFIKKWLNNQDYDYVFIDSRTGINDYSGICNIQLPDANVVVMAANNQNLEGGKRIINGILNSEYTEKGFRKKYIFPILSRININHSDFDYWANKFTDYFSELLCNIDESINSLFYREIFKGFFLEKTILPDDPKYSVGENLLINNSKLNISRNSFAAKFVNLGEYILSVSNQGTITIADQVDRDTWMAWAELAESNKNKIKAAIAYEKAGGFDNKIIELGGTYNAFLRLGLEANNKGDKNLALDYFTKALNLNPKSHEVLYNLGLVHLSKNNHAQAINNFKKSLEYKADKFESFYSMGLAFSAKGDKDEALASYESAIKIKNDFDAAYYNIGNIYYDKKDFKKAIDYFNQALLFNSNKYEAFFNIAQSHRMMGDTDLALLNYFKSLEINPDLDVSYHCIGDIYSAKKEFNEAINFYMKALKINPTKYEVLINIGSACFLINDLQNARRYFGEAIRFAPNEFHYEALNNIGLIYYEHEHYTDALEYFNKALELSPYSHQVLLNIGNVYYAQKNYDSAIESYLEVLKINPQNQHVLNNLGVINSVLGNYSKALEYYEWSLKNNPQDYQVLNNIANCYLELGDKIKAIAYYIESIKINNRFGIAYESLGLLYLEIKEFEKAKVILGKAVELGFGQLGNMGLGHIYFLEGEYEKAFDFYIKSYHAYDIKDLFWNKIENDFVYFNQDFSNGQEYVFPVEELKNRLSVQ